jgi:hypothetical protein
VSKNYGLPEEALRSIRARDTTCVYCHKAMTNHRIRGKYGDCATIEHLNRFPPWNNPATVAICCGSCNSSRGDKKLLDWFETTYCRERNISVETVAEPVREYIRKHEGWGRLRVLLARFLRIRE